MQRELSDDSYSRVLERLIPDGTLRDVHVLNSSVADWQKLIEFIKSGNLTHVFTRGDEILPLPESAEQFFIREPFIPILRLSAEGIDLMCYFFGPTDIEFDFDPRQVRDKVALEKVIKFMISLGRHLKKEVVLTTESRWDDVILRYSFIQDELVVK